MRYRFDVHGCTKVFYQTLYSTLVSIIVFKNNSSSYHAQSLCVNKLTINIQFLINVKAYILRVSQ